MKYNETLISSNMPKVGEAKPFKANDTTKVLIYVDAVIATAWLLSEDHEDYTPDTFEIIHAWVPPNKVTSKEDEELLTALKDSRIVELRYGTYTVQPISSKKRLLK